MPQLSFSRMRGYPNTLGSQIVRGQDIVISPAVSSILVGTSSELTAVSASAR